MTIFFKLFFNSFVIVVFVYASSDYCTLQETKCNREHIACNNHSRYENSTANWTNFALHEFSETQKSDLLSKFNTIKNRYANGDFARRGFPKASKFSVIHWNNELESLAKLTVSKLGFLEMACTVTEDLDSTYIFYYRDIGNKTNIHDFVTAGIDYSVKVVRRKAMRWFANYFAETAHVGCAAAEYVTNGVKEETPDQKFKVLSFHCVADTIGEEKFEYEVGNSCTKCENNRTCDIIYTSLCAL